MSAAPTKAVRGGRAMLVNLSSIHTYSLALFPIRTQLVNKQLLDGVAALEGGRCVDVSTQADSGHRLPQGTR